MIDTMIRDFCEKAVLVYRIVRLMNPINDDDDDDE